MARKNTKLASPEEMEGLPDLPALESVWNTDRDALPMLLIYGGWSVFTVCFIVDLYVRYREYVDTQTTVLVALLVLATVWLSIWTMLGYSMFKTDGSGLTLKGPLRRRYIPWTEILSASIGHTWTSDIVVSLTTSQGRVSFLPQGFGLLSFAGNAIVASIWQHLRQIDRAEGMLLPKSVLRCWEPVPDDIPQDIDWGKPASSIVKAAKSVVLLIMVLFVVLPWFLFNETAVDLAMGALVSLGYAVVLKSTIVPEMIRTAYAVSIRDSYLEAVLLRSKVQILWADISLARCTRNYFCIKSKTGQEVRIPYKIGDKKVERLLLAVVRKLRSSGFLVALPRV